MFNVRCCQRTLLAAVTAILVTGSGAVRAQGLFDFLFRPPAANAYAPAAPGVAPSPGPAAGAPRLSGSGRYSAYCVRLCDGRYFPIQRTGTSQAAEACSSLCPASKTKIFSGTEINQAAASDGTRYSSLENAFVYREKTVDGCTCNGTDPYGLAKIDVANDPTLRKGDLIATENGLERYNGSSKALARASNKNTAGDSEPVATGSTRRSVDTRERVARERPRRPPSIFSIFGL